MKRTLLSSVLVLVLLGLVSTACGGTLGGLVVPTSQPIANVSPTLTPDTAGTGSTGVVSSDSGSIETPTAVPPAEGSPAASTGTPIASHGGPVKDYVSLVDNLRAAGANVQPSDEVSQPFFSVKGFGIKVNGSDVQAFEYPDTAAAEAEAATVAPSGSPIGTNMVSWVDAPHFYKAGRVIVLYVGSEPTVLKVLQSALGNQFAGK